MTRKLVNVSNESEVDAKLAPIIEAAIARLREGEGIDFEALTAANPECAVQLRDLLPTIQNLVRTGAPQATSINSSVGDNGRSLVLGCEQLGDFRIQREIGRGGMGIVYEAIHVPLARRVALKVLPAVNSFDAARLRRFKSESQAVARLQHPNIVQVYAVGSENDVHYYAMQLIDGYSLSTAIATCRREHGKTTEERAEAKSRDANERSRT